ncbi:MAG: DnaJ domain-containing protein [Alphaproteobacteria bacterium]|nr:DnaJ domain-containing protein [Alphaproteobacteria bacterium]
MSDQDYYKILKISPTAKAEEIKKAYHHLAKKYHPDVNKEQNKKSAEEKLKQINEAYAVLKDGKKRKVYDQARKNKPMWENSGTFSRRFSKQRIVAFFLLIFYLLFLSTGFNQNNPFDIKAMLISGHTHIEQTLNQIKNQTIKKFHSSSLAQKLLFLAVIKDWQTVIQLLLENGMNANLIGRNGRNLLMYAQSPQTAQLLIDHGADINHLSPDNHTPYTLAIKKNRKLATFLRQKGARLIWKNEVKQKSAEKRSKR